MRKTIHRRDTSDSPSDDLKIIVDFQFSQSRNLIFVRAERRTGAEDASSQFEYPS